MTLRIQKHPKIITKNIEGNVNGFLIPIYNVHDGFISKDHLPQQVYLTVCEVDATKGPHLHLKRWGYFTCIRGNIRIVACIDGNYEEYFSGENYDYATIEILAGIPAAIQNIGDEPAYVLNTPSPAWHIDNQDENSVEFNEDVLFPKKI
jgi:dTDP-4-dehydrorhamnose 3,5-epimerase-like enzyme